MQAEYRIGHERFPSHARVAYLMAMVAPTCALVLGFLRNLDSPWLRAACSGGLALALCLHSVIRMHRTPQNLSRIARRLVAESDTWFPYFFVVIQSIVASLIMVFVWFSVTTLALTLPSHVHVLLLALALLLPFRRYAQARIMQGVVSGYDRRAEYYRGLWHVLAAYIFTHVFMAITAYDVLDRPHENIHWQTTLWVPAVLYMLFAVIIMLARLKNIAAVTSTRSGSGRQADTIDQF